jgi:hypothetical protein
MLNKYLIDGAILIDLLSDALLMKKVYCLSEYLYVICSLGLTGIPIKNFIKGYIIIAVANTIKTQTKSPKQ